MTCEKLQQDAGARRVPRMRTVSKAVAEIRAMDPDSEVTEYWLRKLVRTGCLPVVWAGTKALVDLDTVLDILAHGTDREEPPIETVGGIRRIAVR